MRVARRILIAGIILAVLVAAWRFARENATPVTVYLWWGQIDEAPLWIALAATFVIGAFTAGLLGAYKLAKVGLLARRYRRAVAGLEAEVHQLRNLPLSAEEAARPNDDAPAMERGAGRGA